MKEWSLKWPEMILFDCGQTLMNETEFNGRKGVEACMEYALTNPWNKTAAELDDEYQLLKQQLSPRDPMKRHLRRTEIPYASYMNYIYGGYDITFSKSPKELERILWDAGAPAKPTEGVQEFLSYLREKKIRTGVISNMPFCGEVLQNRLEEGLPGHVFEFVMASSDYIFRKPNPNIFHLALRKARLLPEQVWYIGDQLQCDVVGAADVGIQPVWYTGAIDTIQKMPEAELMEKTLLIESWAELNNIMKKRCKSEERA